MLVSIILLSPRNLAGNWIFVFLSTWNKQRDCMCRVKHGRGLGNTVFFFFSFFPFMPITEQRERATGIYCHHSLESPIFSLLVPNRGEIAKPEKCEETRQEKTDWQLCFQNKSGAPCLFQIIREFKERFRLRFRKQICSFSFLLPRLVTPSRKI